MILTKNEIIIQHNLGNIIIEPFDLLNVNPNSYNYRLGKLFKTLESEIEEIPEAGLLLIPRKLYLFQTLEKIGSTKYVTSLIGKSSVARLGIFVQIDSDMGNLGNSHNWTLEITAVQPVIVYPEMIIGQISFWQTKGNINNLYIEGYSDFNLPKNSILER